MTIMNRELHAVYEDARDGKMSHELKALAEQADDTLERLIKDAKKQNLEAPNDDRAENLVCDVFEYLLTSNGFNWRHLVTPG